MKTFRIFFGSGVLLLAIASLNAAASVRGGPSPTLADHSLMNYMMRTTFGSDPATAGLCFGYFVPILNNITIELSKNYQQCAATEEAEVNALNDNADSDRYQLELAADGVCVRLDACNELANALDFFDCFAGQGRNGSRVLYLITQNSTEIGGQLREQLRLVDINRQHCQNASERAYVEDTALTYKQLDICLQTGNLPSTASPVTTTESTTPTTISVTDTTTSIVESTTVVDIETTTAVTENEPEPTTAEPPIAEELANGRGLKILSKLRSYWSK